jgi:hypothetical protein
VIFLKKILRRKPKKNSRQRNSSPRASRLALGEEFFAESFFLALGEEFIHREFLSSPRVFVFTLSEEFFAESPREGSRQRFLLSVKDLFPVVPLPARPPLPAVASPLPACRPPRAPSSARLPLPEKRRKGERAME